MRLKILFSRVYSVIIVLLVLLIILSILMYRNHGALVESNEVKYKSLVISEQLRKSSNDLTTFCRFFIETGDTIWKNRYYEVLDIRDGKRAAENGIRISLQDSARKLGFTQAELAKLQEAEQNSNHLAAVEKVAIHAFQGLFADSVGEFTVKGRPDTLLAHQLLYDERYLQSKRAIMAPIDECIRMVEERTQRDVDKTSKANRLLLLSKFALIVLLSLFVFTSFFAINKKISLQFGELEKAKADAEHNQTKFRLIFELSPDIVALSTFRGDIIDCNPAGLAFHGIASKEEFSGANFPALYADPTQRDEIIRELKERGRVRNKGVKLKSLKGGYFIDSLISSELIRWKEDEPLIVSWVRDVTEQLHSQETILKLSAAVSQSPAAIIITDLTGRIEYANRQFSAVTGYANEELIGKYPSLLQSGAHSRAFYKDLWDTILSGKTWIGEIYNRRKDGSFYWEAATIAPIVNETGEIKNFVAIKQDVTDKKLAEIALIESRKKLKELNDTKNRLFSIIGHDLRGPIGNLQSFIELMIQNPDNEDTQYLKQSLKMLLSSTTTTFELLENLLLWAKSQQNEIVFRPEDTDLHQIAEVNILLVSEMIKMKEIAIHNHIPDPQIVCVDKNMIMTVIRNLLTNAIKFTQSGGNIHLSLQEELSSFTVCIQDEGVGMAPEVVEGLFNPKVNYSTPGTAGEKGSGLGLLICWDFIEKHNGKIWVESEKGVGSTFKFSIPKTLNA